MSDRDEQPLEGQQVYKGPTLFSKILARISERVRDQ